MKAIELEKSLLNYETNVRFPDVSGMEHLDMLLTRSKIEDNKAFLSQEQRLRLAVADRILEESSDQFYFAIVQVADLIAWRQNVDAPTSSWWWYLDVLANAKLSKIFSQPSPVSIPV